MHCNECLNCDATITFIDIPVCEPCFADLATIATARKSRPDDQLRAQDARTRIADRKSI